MNSIYRKALFCVVSLLSLIGSSVVAQNLNTSNLTTSPYTRYGFGRLSSTGNSVNHSMGDVGIAVRSNQFTNLMNPAALTAIDTLTMIFSCDLDAQYGHFSEEKASSNQWDAGFSGMSFQAPLWRNFAMSLSLQPYSSVGYYYGAVDKKGIQNPVNPNDTLSYSNTHLGVGGVNNFMFGLGWRAFHNRRHDLNVGVNVGWLFGNIEHASAMSTSSQANSTTLVYDTHVNAMLLKFGLQYTFNLDAKNSVTLGATFKPKMNFDVDAQISKYSTDTINVSDKYRSDIQQPMEWGIGLAYNYNRQLTISAEYEMAQWSKVKGLDPDQVLRDDIYNDVNRVAIGAELRPKLVTNNFFMACRYRAGLSYKTSYVKVDGNTLNEVGATLGMSMPINKRSALNLGFGYSHLQSSNGNLMKENYLTFNLGLTFNEMMFFRNMLR